MALKTLPDATGDGAVHSLVPTGDTRTAAWIQITITGASATSTYIGDANISASQQGAPIPCGGAQFLPWRKQPEHSPYRLDEVYYLAPSGVKVSTLYSTD